MVAYGADIMVVVTMAMATATVEDIMVDITVVVITVVVIMEVVIMVADTMEDTIEAHRRASTAEEERENARGKIAAYAKKISWIHLPWHQ